MNIRDHQKVLDELKTLIERQQGFAVAVSPGNTDWMTVLDGQKQKTREGIFRVLVMGAFNAGKSSFINALLGHMLLPTKMLPATAIITELYYGETPKVTMYPKKEENGVQGKPFSIRPDEMAKYCTIDNDAGINTQDGVIDSRYEKMVVHWPLDLLKDGVSIIDSPGLNDPYSHDTIVYTYLPQADAIIYLCQGTQAYTMSDREALDSINASNVRSLIMVTTFYDIVRQLQTRPGELEEYRRTNAGHYAKHSDLGPDGFHFVSSLESLNAKQMHNDEMLVRSGFAEMEKYLSNYLMQNKARNQIETMTGSMLQINTQVNKSIDTQIQVASTDASQLQARIEQANQQLEDARAKGTLLSREFRTEIMNMLPSIRKEARTFAEKLPQEATLEDFTPQTEIPVNIHMLNPMYHKAKGKKITEECAAHLEERLKTAATKWATTELEPKIMEKLRDSARSVQGASDRFNESLAGIDSILTTGQVDLDGVGKSGVAGYASGILLGLITGDWLSALIGPVYGARNLGRTVAFQLGAGVVMGIVACFFPVSLVAILIASLAASITALVTGGKSKIKEIKRKVEKDYKESLKNPKAIEETVDGVEKFVCEKLEEFAAMFAEAVTADIESKGATIQQAIKQKNSEKGDKTARIAQLKQLQQDVQALNQKVGDIRTQYGIAK